MSDDFEKSFVELKEAFQLPYVKKLFIGLSILMAFIFVSGMLTLLVFPFSTGAARFIHNAAYSIVMMGVTVGVGLVIYLYKAQKEGHQVSAEELERELKSRIKTGLKWFLIGSLILVALIGILGLLIYFLLAPSMGLR